MDDRSSWQIVAGLIFMIVGAVLTAGAVAAYHRSVGTPYYAGIFTLSTLPGTAFLIGLVFILWGGTRGGK
jgi:hypothetical protein